METFDLLSAVQPPDGFFAIVGIQGDNVRHTLVETREEADRAVAQFLAQERNVFFGVAKYKTDAGRSKENVKALRALWLDIDCGETKAQINEKTGRPDGYIDQETALEALRDFCKLTGLPKPTIVNSGRGLHIYWILDRDVTREEWEPVAYRLRDLCHNHNFYADPAVFEVARILRVPGTLNFKDDPAKPVEVITVGKPVSFDSLTPLLGVKHVAAKPKWQPSALGRSMSEAVSFSFKKIMRRSEKGEGCAQLLYAYENRADLDYYDWFHAISVAAMCEDAQEATHMMSEGHPDYDPATLDAKVATIKGATSCAKFEGKNPDRCAGCKWKGQILGPKYLGREIKEAKSNRVEGVLPTDDGEEELQTFEIPEYPFPFFRPEGGGIWRKPPPGAEEAEPTPVYRNDLYVVKRMTDPNPKVGEMVVFRLHLPQDGIKEFVMPLNEVTGLETLRKGLSTNSVAISPSKYKLLADYIIASVDTMQDTQRAEKMRDQFGWADNDTKFIIGDQEISKDGILYSPPSSVTASMAKHMGPVGDLKKWKEVWALYGRPGLEAHAFAALSAFGAPLLKFLKQTGAAMNLMSPESGTGKTTIMRMAMSVYGHPTELIAKKSDTLNAKMQWLAIMKNLPFCVDEITNMEEKEFSELVYSISQGKAKERMTAGGNELRINNTTWQTISLCTANASFYEKLSTDKNTPDGEMMRLIEYKVAPTDVIGTEEGKLMFDQQLMENYGHAGPIFMQYVLNNMEEVREACMFIQAKLDRELNLTQRERFWSAGVAAPLAGGFTAKMLGLIDWDMNRIYRWACNMILQLREEAEPPATNTSQIVGDFVNRYIQNTLVVNDQVDKRSNKEAFPVLEPKGELLIRYEPDTKLLFIVVKKFREYCVQYQISYKDTIRKLKEEGILKGSGVKRMSKGMKITVTGVQALCLDTSAPGFLDMEAVVPTGESDTDAGGES